MLCSKLIRQIDQAIEADGGTAYRASLAKYLPLMDDAYRPSPESPFRKHLGVSGIGKTCSRAVWYTFRWATKENLSGQTLRLFNRGHLEEARFLAMLEAAGIPVWQGPEDGGQFKLSYYGGHFGTALDGVCSDIPDFPDTPMLLEFKTSNTKNFSKLTKGGVEIEKEQHFIQCQIGMAEYGLSHALYMVVNKDNDDLYAESIPFRENVAAQYFNLAHVIIFDRENIPRKISTTPSWFECKFCSHSKVCHFKTEPEKHCRSCEHLVAKEDGSWFCEKNAEERTHEEQLAGCSAYKLNELFHFPL